MMKCIRCNVSGRVQGVFYRASTRQKALELGICGWARNLPDGSVEVLACGETAVLEELLAWLEVGPPHAQVEKVDWVAIEDQVVEGFRTV